MYGTYLNNNSNIEEAKVVAQTYRAPRNAYDSSVISKIKDLRADGYGKSLMQKSTYAVRGGIVGGVVFAGGAMFFKRNVWGFSILGIMAGTVTGYFVGKLITKKTE